MLVSVGLGWSLLPQTMVDQQLRMLPVRGLQLQRTSAWCIIVSVPCRMRRER